MFLNKGKVEWLVSMVPEEIYHFLGFCPLIVCVLDNNFQLLLVGCNLPSVPTLADVASSQGR